MSCITVYNKLQEVAQYDSESWAESAVVTLGRNPLTNLPFEHISSLSNHHLSIRKLEGHFYIRDEQSSNGTSADGVPLTHAIRMQVGVTYQAGPLTIFLEDAPLIPVSPDENADSVFPEPYAFALIAAEEVPAEPVYEAPVEPAYEAPVEPVYEAPVEPAYEAPAEPVYEAPAEVAPVVLDAEEDGSFDLEKLAALKKSGAGPAAVQMAPQKVSLPKPFLPIGGIPKAGIPQDFRLELSTLDGSTQIREGEALQLRVRTSLRCKLILICKDANDTKTMLYPNRYQPGTDIPPNQWVTLPEEGTINYEFAIEGVGIDTIQAIGRMSEGVSVIRKAQAKGAEGQSKPEKAKAKWAYASIQIEVLPALEKK